MRLSIRFCRYSATPAAPTTSTPTSDSAMMSANFERERPDGGALCEPEDIRHIVGASAHVHGEHERDVGKVIGGFLRVGERASQFPHPWGLSKWSKSSISSNVANCCGSRSKRRARCRNSSSENGVGANSAVRSAIPGTGLLAGPALRSRQSLLPAAHQAVSSGPRYPPPLSR